VRGKERDVFDQPITVLAGIVVLGVGAQWLAWSLKLPSILVLLVFGILVGPVAGLLAPDAVFGDLLLPIVSLSVALILYEGGLSLRLAELRSVGGTVGLLVTAGALVTWAGGAAAAWGILGLDPGLAILLGAILVVTGPTVIQPLLRHVRPRGSVGRILKWEGIVIDPIGALLSVLVFEAILSGELRGAPAHAAAAIAKTIVFGGAFGLAGAGALVLLLRKYWVPDALENAVSLMFVLAAFTASNALQEESGLFAVTLMGVAVANQKFTGIEHIIEFKENLRVLLLSSLFILLAARIDLAYLASVGVAGALFTAVLILAVRPAMVFVSTIRSNLAWREKAFLAWLAPRGIVAASVASIFALRLDHAGHDAAPALLSATFAVILGTVTVYGLTARPLARWLGLAERDPDGVLLLGADRLTRAIAERLHDLGKAVLVVDSNRAHLVPARMAGIRTYAGSVLADPFLDEVDLGGIGRLLALTPNDWVNGLASRKLARVLGGANVFQITPARAKAGTEVSPELRAGRPLFGEEITYGDLARRISNGAEVKATPLGEEFGWDRFLEKYGAGAIPLFVVTAAGRLAVVSGDEKLEPGPGDTIVSLVTPSSDESPEPAPRRATPPVANPPKGA